MKKYIYDYSNGERTMHSRVISTKTMRKEGKESERVEVYIITNLEDYDKALEVDEEGNYRYSVGIYLETISLK